MSWRLIKTFQDLGLSINPSGSRISDVLVGGYSTKAGDPCEENTVATVTLKAEDIIHSHLDTNTDKINLERNTITEAYLGANADQNYPNLKRVIDRLCEEAETAFSKEEGIVIYLCENSIGKMVVLKMPFPRPPPPVLYKFHVGYDKEVILTLKGDGSIAAPPYGGAQFHFFENPRGKSYCHVYSNDIGSVANQIFAQYNIKLYRHVYSNDIGSVVNQMFAPYNTVKLQRVASEYKTLQNVVVPAAVLVDVKVMKCSFVAL